MTDWADIIAKVIYDQRGSSSSGSSSSSSSGSSLPFILPSTATSQFTRQNLYYRNTQIYIDGYIFKNCRFDQCKLITMKGNFRFVNCIFDGQTKVEYKGNALNIIKLYNRIEHRREISLSPTENLDGTVTI